VRMLGFEATMAVDDIAATIAAVEAAGGRTATTPVYIEGVGKLVYFQDPDGNVFGPCSTIRSPIELRRRLSGPLRRDNLPPRMRLDRHDHPWANSPSATAA